MFGSDFLQPCVNLRLWLEHSLKQPEFSVVLGKFQLGAAVEKKEKAPMEAKPKKEAAPKGATAKKEIEGKACEFFCLDWNVLQGTSRSHITEMCEQHLKFLCFFEEIDEVLD